MISTSRPAPIKNGELRPLLPTQEVWPYVTQHASLLPPRVQQLSEELVRRGHEEEREAQALESMVHSVEQNLQLMTVGPDL